MPSLTEVQAMLDLQWRHFVQANQYSLLNRVESYMSAQKQNFGGEQYLDRIERGTIYVAEKTGVLTRKIAQHLHSGLPRFHFRTGLQYVDHLSSSPAMKTSPGIVSFIRDQVSELGQQWSHLDYSILRDLRKNSPKEKYFEEIEFRAKWVQAELFIGNMLLYLLLKKPNSNQYAKNLSLDNLHRAIIEQLDTITDLELGTRQPKDTD
jgi:hypothetical protein